MKNIKAFTLVELVIVIVIVAILSIIAVPIYRGYTRKAMLTEGQALLSSIEKQEKIYYVEFANYLAIPDTSFSSSLSIDVDARSNKYFTSFRVDLSGNGFTASTTGINGASGIVLTLTSADMKEKSTMTATNVDN